MKYFIRGLLEGIAFSLLVVMVLCAVLYIAGCAPKSPSVVTVRATPQQKGLDLLGLLRFTPQQIKDVNTVLPHGSVIGVLLDETFGHSWAPLRTVLNSGKVTVVTADLFNTTAVRNGVLQKEELLYGYTVQSLNRDACSLAPKLRRIVGSQISRLRQFESAHPGVRFDRSLFLESNLDPACAQSIFNYARSIDRPGVVYIDNPMQSRAAVGGTILEKHGNNVSAPSVSNDGVSLFDANMFGVAVGGYPSYLTAASVYLEGWIDEFNLRKSGEKQFTPPLQRPKSFGPTADQLRHAVRILFTAPDPLPPTKPAQCATSRQLQARELWKTDAEDYGNGDVRGSKPLFITRWSGGTIEVLNLSGRKVGYLKYYGPYSGDAGYNRYYLGTGSGQTAMGLFRAAGSEWVYLKQASGCVLVNSVRRTGYYRNE